MRILLAEDDASLSDRIKGDLVQRGYAVDVADNGVDAEYLGDEGLYDAVILDLGLPQRSGLQVLRNWRGRGNATPVLILTARDAWHEKVEGFDAGADDYVAKPFHFQELLARVQALLRRSGGWAQPVLRCGPVALDPRTQEVSVNDKRVDLTSFEYRILEYLIHRAGEVISKAELTERLYAQDFDRDSNTIEVFIGRLRRKLDPDNRHQPIETLRGRGYRVARA